MKTSNKVLFGGLLLVFLTGVIFSAISRANTKVWTKEECESMKTVTKNLDLTFEGIDASQNINIILQQGDFKVDLQYAEEVGEHLNHEVVDGIFKLYFDKNNYNTCPVTCTIRCPDLSRIQLANGAQITTVGQFEASQLEVVTQNGSSAELNLTANRLDVTTQNSGDVKLTGVLGILEIAAVNSARVDARDTQVSKAMIKMANSADVTIKADTIVRADLSNSSSLSYIGETHLGNMNSNNSSSIRKIDQ